MDTPETPSAPQPEAVFPRIEKNPIAEYFSTLFTILSSPGRFFRELKPGAGVTAPILFAVLTHWLGAGLAYIWKVGFGKMIEGRMADFMVAFQKLSSLDEDLPAGTLKQMKDHFLTWVWGVGSVLIDPFLSVLSILMTGFLIWLGARILGDLRQADADERYSFESAVTIVAYSYAASLLQGLPLVGGMVAALFTFVITFIAAREYYKVSSPRAVVISLFPKILVFLFFFGIFLSILLLFMKFFIGAA